MIQVKRYNGLKRPAILPTKAPQDISGAFHEVGNIVSQGIKSVRQQDTLKAEKQASDIEVQAWDFLNAARESGDENIRAGLESFINESLETSVTEDGFYNDALRAKVEQIKPRLLERAGHAERKNRYISSSETLRGVIDNKAFSASSDPSAYEQYLNEALSEIDSAFLLPEDKNRMKVQARDMIAGAAVGARIRENPLETAAALREGKYNSYFDVKTVRALERQADDEAFYRQLRSEPESLLEHMDAFGYDEKTKFERERQVKAVLKASKEKQAHGVSKDEADSQSALQSIRAQFFKDAYTEMKAKKKDRDLFSLLNYRDIVGQAYGKKEINDRQFSGLMKETVMPLLTAAQGEAFKKPLFHQTAFEYSVKKLNGFLGRQMDNPALKAAVLDQLYGRMREAGIDPDAPRKDSKEAVNSVLSGIYRDFAEQESPYLVPENVDAMVLGGRYFPLSVRENENAPKRSAPVKDGGLFQDAKGNVYRQSGGIMRLVSQAVPEPAPKARTIEDVLEEYSPAREDHEYMKIIDSMMEDVEKK